MDATPDRPDLQPSVALATFVDARLGDLRELFDERMKGIQQLLEHDRELQAREHQQLLTAFAEAHEGIGLLRDRHDKELEGLENRVDGLESDRDKRNGIRSSTRELVTMAAAFVGMLAGLHVV